MFSPANYRSQPGPRSVEIFGLLLAALGAVACGGRPASQVSRAGEPSLAFQEIKRREAVVEAGLFDLDRKSAGCQRAGSDLQEICENSQCICRIAHEIADADAARRCSSAQDACRRARWLAAGRCGGVQAGPGDGARHE
jgi:hypothetical protein